MRSILSFRSTRTWFMILVLLAVSASAFAGVFVSISIAPPQLPIYQQPMCPGEGYIWTPGYWAYSEDEEGYFWVPGTWVEAPFMGGLWTPGYWGFGNSYYAWHPGYWGRQVGFYGGVDYGYGYGGRGYEGGYWDHDRFNYNRTVNNINVTNIHNTYNKTVINNVNVNRVSYNGGNGGVSARPTGPEQAALRQKRQDVLPAQMQHEQAAKSNRQQWASVNHGNPAVAATPRPGGFNDRGAVPARPVGMNHEAPNRIAPPHNEVPLAPTNGAQGTMPVRARNPSGNGTAPLITAHPTTSPAPMNQVHSGQPASNNQNVRPVYNGAPQQDVQPQHQQSVQTLHPQNVQPQQHQQMNQQQPRYSAPPSQHQQNAQPQYQPQHQQNVQPQQQRNSAPPQQQMQQHPQPQYQPQHQQSAQPQQQRNSAPPQQQMQHQQGPPPQQHPQSAPQSHGGGEPHGDGGHSR